MLRKQVLSIIAVTLAVAICTSSVVAVTNQGFTWGISVGQRLDYDYYRERSFFNDTRFEDYSSIKDIQFYNIIESLPAISDDIESWGDLPDTPNRTCYYANGTEPTFPYIWYVIPIGNWDLIIDLWIGSGVNESEIVDTPQFVGYNSTWSLDGGNMTFIYAEIYSRSTGVLHTLQQYYPMESLITQTEVVLIPSDDIPVIYILAAGGIVSVVLVVIVLMKRK